MSCEDLGEALSAEFNAKVTDAGEKREDVKKSTVAGWKREETQLRKVWDNHKATPGDRMIRNKDQQNPQMEEALYVWLRHMEARDMTISEEIIKTKTREFGGKQVSLKGSNTHQVGFKSSKSGLESSRMCFMGKLVMPIERASS
jgi:hypothetical protein